MCALAGFVRACVSVARSVSILCKQSIIQVVLLCHCAARFFFYVVQVITVLLACAGCCFSV